jgi:hypothetical protein
MDRKHVFQVDLAQFRGIELQEKPANGVPNLLIRFDSCSFRIFSEEALANNDYDDFRLLKTAASRLKKAASAFQRLSIFQGNEDHQTPLQSTDSTWAHSSNDVHNQEHEGTESNREGANMCRAKRKRSALARSWDGLHSLQAVLEMPHNAAEEDDGISETIGPILTASAEELASSYCRKKDLRSAMQSCSNDISSCEAQLNDIFAAGFPPPRNRRNASPAKTQPSEENTDTMLETAQALLTKQRNAVKQRLELSLLPTRE